MRGIKWLLGLRYCPQVTKSATLASGSSHPCWRVYTSSFKALKCKLLSVVFVAPALALNGPGLQVRPQRDEDVGAEQQSPGQPPSILDTIVWMAAPKKRRSIEINRTRRRADEKLIKVKVRVKNVLMLVIDTCEDKYYWRLIRFLLFESNVLVFNYSPQH